MNTLSKVFVGVDVSKRHLDVCMLPENKSFKIANNKSGHRAFLKKVAHFQVERVVCESSGGYEQKFIHSLDQAEYKTWIVDPKRVKAFISAEGVRAKTDKIDAKMIAMFASKITPRYSKKIVSSEKAKLKEFVKRKTELTEMLAKEKTRLKDPTIDNSINFIKKLIKFMEKQMDIIEKEIEKIIQKDGELQQKVEIMETMPGVGKITSAALVAHLPELGILNSKQIAALVGVAPFTKESGTYVGKASIGGGRAIPRKALYMAALTASRSNPVFKNFYNRLIAKGKKPKVALVGVMRKIIITLNAMLKNGTVWNPKIA